MPYLTPFDETMGVENILMAAEVFTDLTGKDIKTVEFIVYDPNKPSYACSHFTSLNCLKKAKDRTGHFIITHFATHNIYPDPSLLRRIFLKNIHLTVVSGEHTLKVLLTDDPSEKLSFSHLNTVSLTYASLCEVITFQNIYG